MNRQKKSAYYAPKRIDTGAFGAVYHPVTGEPLAALQYDKGHSRFYRSETHIPLAWDVEGGTCREYLPRIGDGNGRGPDSLAHSHWRFDPRTGQPLSITS